MHSLNAQCIAGAASAGDANRRRGAGGAHWRSAAQHPPHPSRTGGCLARRIAILPSPAARYCHTCDMLPHSRRCCITGACSGGCRIQRVWWSRRRRRWAASDSTTGNRPAIAALTMPPHAARRRRHAELSPPRSMPGSAGTKRAPRARARAALPPRLLQPTGVTAAVQGVPWHTSQYPILLLPPPRARSCAQPNSNGAARSAPGTPQTMHHAQGTYAGSSIPHRGGPAGP